MNWTEILLIEFVTPLGIKIAVGPVLLIVIGFLILWRIFVFYKHHPVFGWETVEEEFHFGQMWRVKIKRNHEVIRIAHQAWAELQTRKAALPFDQEHDVITEIYDSWYQLFGEFRKLIRSIPAEQIRENKDTKELLLTMVAVLNDGLRPHLTCWQARFRVWYKSETEKNPQEDLQTIQKRFPKYADLIGDLQCVNEELRKYSSFLCRVAHGDNSK